MRHEVIGSLKMLGSSKQRNLALIGDVNWVDYINIEIGNVVLTNIACHVSLNHYLRSCLNVDGVIKLYLSDKKIIGIELPAGNIYCYKRSKAEQLMIGSVGTGGLGGLLFGRVIGLLLSRVFPSLFGNTISNQLKEEASIAVELEARGASVVNG